MVSFSHVRENECSQHLQNECMVRLDFFSSFGIQSNMKHPHPHTKPFEAVAPHQSS